MKKILSLLCVAVAILSCSKAGMNENNGGEGVLKVDMNISSLTKAALDADQLKNTATVKIYKADFSGLVRSYTFDQMPSPFYLAADTYRVDIEAGESVKENPAAASWEQKSYKGTKEFTIVAGQVTNVEVEAGVNNAVTAITFDQTVVENFADGYSFTIGLDESAQLVYDASKSGAEGYFIVAGLDEPSFTWTFEGTLFKDGSSFVKTGTIADVLPGKLYRMNLRYTIKDGDIDFTLMVDYTTDIVDNTIVFEPVSTGLAPSSVYEIWATKATIHADVDPSSNAGATVRFGYSSNGSDWKYADGVNDSEGTWMADVKGLTPATEYTYKLFINDVETGEPRTFTTEAAPQLPNHSFEYVSKVSDGDYYKFYDPNCGVEEGSYMFWGSGNGEGADGVKGSANMGYIITQVDQSDFKDGKQSVKCVNSSAAGLLTAGNLFAGQFVGLVGSEGGKVNFGRPWTSRPSAVRLWCKYSTGKINVNNGFPAGVNLTSNDYDRAQIKVALGTWTRSEYGGTKDSPVHVNTTDPSTFVDFYTDKATIANGDLIIHNDGYDVNRAGKVTAVTTGWIQYTIPLDYRNLTTYPTHIAISCSASQYGDYFSGCKEATLWIDKFELIYE